MNEEGWRGLIMYNVARLICSRSGPLRLHLPAESLIRDYQISLLFARFRLFWANEFLHLWILLKAWKNFYFCGNEILTKLTSVYVLIFNNYLIIKCTFL